MAMRPLYLGVGECGQRVHVLHVHLRLVEADGVVSKFLGDAVALAVDLGMLVHHHFREQVGNGKLVVGQHLEQPALDATAHVDRIDHHHVPVARLRLLDDGDAGSGALEFLDVHLDAIGILERLQEVRIGVIAPHQRVEIRGISGAVGKTKHSEGGERGTGEAAREFADGHDVFLPVEIKN